MKISGVLRVFLESDMRNGHAGLREIAKKAGFSVDKLSRGEFFVFLNKRRDKVKIFAADQVLVYKHFGGEITPKALSEIPKIFKAGSLSWVEEKQLGRVSSRVA